MSRGRITRVKLNLICDADEYKSLEETYFSMFIYENLYNIIYWYNTLNLYCAC